MPGSPTTPGRTGARANASVRVAFRTFEQRRHPVTSSLSRLNGWPMRSPTDASPTPSRDASARLGADADRYSFTVVDFHLLLLAGLPGALSTNCRPQDLPPSPTALPSPGGSRAARPPARPSSARRHVAIATAVQPRARSASPPGRAGRRSEPAPRSTRHLGLHDPPGSIHHAHAALFQRHVDPGIMHPWLSLETLGADPLGPRSHHHSEGQPPRRHVLAQAHYGI